MGLSGLIKCTWKHYGLEAKKERGGGGGSDKNVTKNNLQGGESMARVDLKSRIIKSLADHNFEISQLEIFIVHKCKFSTDFHPLFYLFVH